MDEEVETSEELPNGNIAARMTEHRYAIKKMDVQNGIAIHVQRHQHSIN